jgi:hypothetical protein
MRVTVKILSLLHSKRAIVEFIDGEYKGRSGDVGFSNELVCEGEEVTGLLELMNEYPTTSFYCGEIQTVSSVIPPKVAG